MFSTPMLAGAFPALVLLFSLLLAHSGEPIQFSNDKAKPAPGSPQQPDADLFKTSRAKRPPSAPLNNGLTPFISYGGSLDPKDERRLKNIREEKKNWMLLEPGELQQRDEDEENQFGGKSITMDNVERDRDSYLFPAPQKSEKAPRQQNAPVEDDQPKKDNRSLSIFGPREAEKPGAHTASELNLKNLIDPSQIDATKFNNNEASLFQFLKDNAAPAPDRDHQARRDSFRDFINGPQPNGAPQGISDPINFRTDLTQQRMNPVLPSQTGLEMSAPAKGAEGFSSRPPLGGAFTPGKASALPDLISSAAPRQPMPGSSLPSPFLTPNDPSKASRPSVMGGSLFNRETPRRGGL